MSKIEPFNDWLNESEEHNEENSTADKFSELIRMRQLGIDDMDFTSFYYEVVNAFSADPAVSAAMQTLNSKFAEYQGYLAQEDEHEIEEIRRQMGDMRPDEIGYWEFLNFYS